MRKYLTIITITFTLYNSAIASISEDYPKTLQERRMDEMGSLLQGEGLVFRPGRAQNESTKAAILDTKVNKYLWQASIETLNFAPLASADSNGGVIITEWYIPKQRTNFRFKINIFIKDNIISSNSLEVRVFEQVFKNGNWWDANTTPNLAVVLEENILRKARDLKLNDKSKF